MSGGLRISDFCFVVAALAALGGMGLGIVMGISQDFTLAPAHAHLNLLGWVTMAIYGLYHRGAGRTGGFAGWTQVGSGGLGAGLMAGGLALPKSFDVFGLSAAVLGLDTLLVCGLARWLFDGHRGDAIGTLFVLGLAAAGLLAASVSGVLRLVRSRA